MKLFGLIESVFVQSIFPMEGRIDVDNVNLFDILNKYDSSLTVGLELACEEKKLELIPNQISLISPEIQFKLLNHFKKKGNKIYFLESNDYYLNTLMPILDRSKELDKQFKFGMDKAQEKSLEIELAKLSIEFDYVHKLGKEKGIIEKITMHKPDLVFLGDAHASKFYINKKELFEKQGITVEEYWQDRATKGITYQHLTTAASVSSEHLSMEDYLNKITKVVTEKVESPELVLIMPEDIFLERAYRALKEGRVTDGKPNAIGTWDTYFKEQGLFEFYITKSQPEGNGKLIEGVIEDCIGSATFSGAFREDIGEIFFSKDYFKNFNGAAPFPLYYKGVIKDGQFTGKYFRYFGSDDNRNFTMSLLKDI